MDLSMENGRIPTDCFGKELKEGDDILITINNTFHAGIIHKITETHLEYDEQIWAKDKEVIITHTVDFGRFGYKLKNIYKIR